MRTGTFERFATRKDKLINYYSFIAVFVKETKGLFSAPLSFSPSLYRCAQIPFRDNDR